MIDQFHKLGYTLYRKVLGFATLASLRSECDRIASEQGKACVRRLTEHSELISQLAHSEWLTKLIPYGLQPVRSILFDKTPQENWPVAWHQDLTIAVRHKVETAGYGPWSIKDGAPHVRPPIELLEQMATIRIHLDDTPAHNGALRIAPGTHRNGVITSIQTYLERSEEEICACEAGDVLLMRPLLLHTSRRSTAPNRRRVIHIEYAPRNALDPNMEWLESDHP